MRRLLSLLPLAALAVAFAPAARAQSSDTCIKAWPETRYGAMAYNHIVHLANSCDPDADCQVSTDVNPDVQKVTVAGHGSLEIMTYMGSPSRTFRPNVQCTMHKS